jgi:NIPSNAP
LDDEARGRSVEYLCSEDILERRRFLNSSLAVSALALAGKSKAQATAPAGSPHEYYELRKYRLQQGSQTKLTAGYLSDALIPALNRLGMSPVGAFDLTYGPDTPAIYLLIPSTSLDTLVTAELRLSSDQDFLKAAQPFWNAPAKEPAFVRIESEILRAFEGWPKLIVPAATAQRAKRIFQLRTYESASHQDHVRKVEMFHSGEFEIFKASGCEAVFYSDRLIGHRMPSLTYMLWFPDLAGLDRGWEAFRDNPDWKKLQAEPRFSFEPIVSNISNLLLSPTPYSQI